jgi:hypothetical protein
MALAAVAKYVDVVSRHGVNSSGGAIYRKLNYEATGWAAARILFSRSPIKKPAAPNPERRMLAATVAE